MARKRLNKSTKPSTGLGDTVEKITTATGIKKAVEVFSELTGIDCGCDARKAKLNQIFRYKTPNCLTKDEHIALGSLVNRSSLNDNEQKELNVIYNRVFNDKVEKTTCSSCLNERLRRMRLIYNEYKVDNG